MQTSLHSPVATPASLRVWHGLETSAWLCLLCAQSHWKSSSLTQRTAALSQSMHILYQTPIRGFRQKMDVLTAETAPVFGVTRDFRDCWVPASLSSSPPEKRTQSSLKHSHTSERLRVYETQRQAKTDASLRSTWRISVSTKPKQPKTQQVRKGCKDLMWQCYK